MLNELVAAIEGVCEALVDVAGEEFWIDQVVERRETGLEKVHLGEGDHIHGDLI